jgi:phosphohistidine swiveling domain-containing protein
MGLEPESWDVLHAMSRPNWHWSRGNIGEALPGVLTPLSWSLWEVAADGSARAAFRAIGAADSAEAVVPTDRSRRCIRAFYGRAAAQLEFLCEMGDRVPGTSASAIAEHVFGEVPQGIVDRKTRRRYPVIAAKLPWTVGRAPSVLRRAAADSEVWWREQTGIAPRLSLEESSRVFVGAAERFRRAVALQATVLFCVVQPVYDALGRLVATAQIADLTALASGYGSVPETAVVADLWRASRGEIDFAQIARGHGFHGPREAELSATVWREDDTPLLGVVREYAAMGYDRCPLERERHLSDQRQSFEREIVVALPRPARPLAQWLLRTAARVVPLRGIAKDSYLQAVDVMRASARRVGELLAIDGVLSEPEDVFFLTDAELVGPPRSEVRDLIRRRRERHDYYLSVDIPTHWLGNPEPLAAINDADAPGNLMGLGVSPGVVEGVARVLTEPSFEDLEPGAILVTPATDPSWSSVMFISSALVVDIGGALSHAAIVARELGIPCVVNTLQGTRTIRTGDRCRVDGASGAVTIIERSADSVDTPLPERTMR